MTLQQKLEEIKERSQNATPGPWENRCQQFSNSERPTSIWTEHGWTARVEGLGPSHSIPNAEFIAHARTDVPLLLKALAKCIEQRDNNLVQKDKAMSHGFILDLSELRDYMNEQLLAIFEGDDQ
jgi:hypothetical protein